MSFHLVICKCCIAVKWSHEKHDHCKDDTRNRMQLARIKEPAYRGSLLKLRDGLVVGDGHVEVVRHELLSMSFFLLALFNKIVMSRSSVFVLF